MRQAGLWEQLITLFIQYLEMNVSNFGNEFRKFDININEEALCKFILNFFNFFLFQLISF